MREAGTLHPAFKRLTRWFRWSVAVLLVSSVGLASVAAADFEGSEAANQQEGSNEADADQEGSAGSGDAVGGQVAGVVSSGDATVDARNRSEDVNVESGDATGSNEADAFAGLNYQATSTVIEEGFSDTGFINSAEFTASDAFNQQDGDNALDLSQTADASSGDAVGGQVIGVVTSAGGSADVVADNASEDVDIETGEGDADNTLDAFVGLNAETESLQVFLGFSDLGLVSAADFTSSTAKNQQEGDNELSAEQAADAASGDGVGGQVIGVVSAGDASVDARNRSEDVEADTGNATADNEATAFAGLDYFASDTEIQEGPGGFPDETLVDASDFTASDASNQQEGDNALDLAQTADATTGDGVGGQVIGVVTSAGGSADVVADNASEDVDVETGNADAANTLDAFVGLNAETSSFRFESFGSPDFGLVNASDFTSSTGQNQQEGDNELSAEQAADAASGDGVGGQVIGVVSAGDASVDARNRSEDADIDTGNATADNDATAFAGLDYFASETDIEISPIGIGSVEAEDFTASTGTNQQEGDNALDLTQTADATTGDGVGGQVIGAVTSAGGSADVVADNASEDTDIETGNADATNSLDAFAGLDAETERFEEDAFFLGIGGIAAADFTSSTGQNQQEGDNELSAEQSADASSGDGVGGQVIGVVSAGDASIDARNRSEDVDIDTGNAFADNEATVFVGLDYFASETDSFVISLDFVSSDASNQQEGDNALDLAQTADATTGDGVGGQVIGAVTSAGGSADVVADNASEDVDIDTGNADATNTLDAFVGLRVDKSETERTFIGLDFTSSNALNQQDGDNELDAAQSADAASGDGVGGQVLGVVSAGDASIDARNRSEDVDISTGDADATNDAEVFVGLDVTSTFVDIFIIGDFDSSTAFNQQDGDNSSSVAQDADATSGDGVAGQVAGVVVSAGGSVDAVLDNASEDIDVDTGDVRHENRLVQTIGHVARRVAEFFGGCSF